MSDAHPPLLTRHPELQQIVDALDDKRAVDVRILDLAPLSPNVEGFVIATAESGPQLTAMQDAVKEATKDIGIAPRGIEAPSSRWVLMDYGGLVVHLMNPEAREFYDLEGFWADADTVAVPPTQRA